MKKKRLPNKASRPSLQLRRILVPIDFSAVSRQALRYAVPLAAQSGGKITLLHAIEIPIYPAEMGMVLAQQESATEAARKGLADLSYKHVPAGLRGAIRVRVGRPYQEIVQAAKKLKMDLIVLTTHGRSGLSRALLGSTAERVVRHAPCPVLTVRKG